MFFTLIFLASSSMGEGQPPNFYNPEGQERCEQICLRCLDQGGGAECFSNVLFKICCHGNGGRVNGCGCREVL
jgi:hypothetical protein